MLVDASQTQTFCNRSGFVGAFFFLPKPMVNNNHMNMVLVFKYKEG